MTRRGLLALLGAGQIATPPPGCDHEWNKGPYYVTVAVTYEEPSFYPPGGVIAVEHCRRCGLLRLDAEARTHVGRYYQAPAGSEARK